MNIPQKEIQRKRILKFLQEHGSITPMDALNEIGCFRLGARIHELRKDGYSIRTEMERKNDKHYARYFLEGESNEQQN